MKLSGHIGLKILLFLYYAVMSVLFLSACGYGDIQISDTKQIHVAESVHFYMSTDTVVNKIAISEKEQRVFSEEITFNCEYIHSDDTMPYALISPSSMESDEALPLIIWLHGMTERNANEPWFMNAGLPGVMANWSLDGFRAYIICPELVGEWVKYSWCAPNVAVALQDIIDSFRMEHNVNEDQIIIGGFSLGGLGAMYMALELPDSFSKLLVLSSLDLREYDLSHIAIPTLGCSETDISYNAFMKDKFISIFGEDSVWYFDSTHNELIDVVFNTDKDSNHCSDVVEWMLSDVS